MRRRVEQLLALSKRYGQPFSLVMVGVEGPGTRSNGEDSEALADRGAGAAGEHPRRG